MSKFDEVVEKAIAQLNSVGIKDVDETLLRAIVKSQGPSVYLRDASLVSCADAGELKRVEDNFLVKKLGVTDQTTIDNVLKKACDKFSDVRQKMRVAFYYYIVKELGKESKFV
ncbi:MAG: DUF2853 family protein [Chlorobi bacterium]|nr:DUF2853 family protein [Chlorobiota bacterium]